MRHFLMYQYNGFPVEDKLIKDMSALVHGLDSCFSHTIPMFRRCHIFEALFTFRFCAEPSWLFTLRWCGMVVFFFCEFQMWDHLTGNKIGHQTKFHSYILVVYYMCNSLEISWSQQILKVISQNKRQSLAVNSIGLTISAHYNKCMWCECQ
jgi:hypothetical protein